MREIKINLKRVYSLLCIYFAVCVDVNITVGNVAMILNVIEVEQYDATNRL